MKGTKVNTLIFVLMVSTHGFSWVPTIEFNTSQKCEAAAISYEAEANKHENGSPRRPWCWKVEK